MIDMHSHILPGIDDGSDSIQTSLDMLYESRNQGIQTVVATSHCYIKTEEDITAFLEKREKSYNLLMEAIDKEKEELPKIVLGCEVHLDRNISKFENLEKLCIDGTDYILLEMPYGHWNSSLYDAIYSMTLRKMRPVMAHIERFFTHRDDFPNLQELGVVCQVNAESFILPGMGGVINYLVKNRMIQLVGSDMHNTDRRPQRLLPAYKRIERLYGMECVDYLLKNSHMILENRYIKYFDFKKKNIFSRLVK